MGEIRKYKDKKQKKMTKTQQKNGITGLLQHCHPHRCWAMAPLYGEDYLQQTAETTTEVMASTFFVWDISTYSHDYDYVGSAGRGSGVDSMYWEHPLLCIVDR